jgi:Flp pilus assembly protein TadG
MVFEVRPHVPRANRRRDRESGQALVEFALILPLFLMIVVGIIQFGVALNFWLDLQRIANQGARWAAVNCGQSASTPGSDPCLPESTPATLAQRLREDVLSEGNVPDADDVEVCYIAEDGKASAGDTVRVRLTTEYVFLGITGFLNDSSGLTIDLHADAAMRLEQTPSSPALPPDTTMCPEPADEVPAP